MLRIDRDRWRTQHERSGLEKRAPDRFVYFVHFKQILGCDRMKFGYVWTSKTDEEQQNERGQKEG